MKRKVLYIDLAYCKVGEPAVVLPLDHPSHFVVNREWTQTTKVIAIIPGQNGPVFETRNSLYMPVDPDGPSAAKMIEVVERIEEKAQKQYESRINS